MLSPFASEIWGAAPRQRFGILLGIPSPVLRVVDRSARANVCRYSVLSTVLSTSTSWWQLARPHSRRLRSGLVNRGLDRARPGIAKADKGAPVPGLWVLAAQG